MLATTYEISMDSTGSPEVLAALIKPVAAISWTPPDLVRAQSHLLISTSISVTKVGVRYVTEEEHAILMSALRKSSKVLYTL